MKFSKELDLRLIQYLRLIRFQFHFRRHRNAILFDDDGADIHEQQSRLMIYTAADSTYLQKFFKPFVKSANAHMRAPRIHIHLYNPQPADFTLLNSVRKDMARLALSWSHENFSAQALEQRSQSSNQQSWKSLYICTSRFIAAEIVQKKFGLPLLITDVDILFNGNVEERFSGAIDVALMLRPEERNICKRTLGGIVYVSARVAGRNFLARTAGSISRFLAAGFYWFAFDQLALYRAVRAMPKDSFATGFSPLTHHDISFDMDQDGLILFPKGKIKDQQEFADLVHSYSENSKTR